jgi:biopolymer transport protein ExbB/TolQ
MARSEAVTPGEVRLLWPGLADWLAVGRELGRRWLLLFRFALLNILAAALVVAAALQGWLSDMFESDRLHLVKLIVAVFAAGLIGAAVRAVRLSAELNAVEAGILPRGSKAAWFLAATAGRDGAGRAAMAALLRLKLQQRLSGPRYLASLLVLLGLIGTVVGFILALAGIDPATVGDAAAIGPMVSRLLEGMAVALYTTLAGSLLNIWLILNCRLLESGAAHLYGRLVERSEAHARA